MIGYVGRVATEVRALAFLGRRLAPLRCTRDPLFRPDRLGGLRAGPEGEERGMKRRVALQLQRQDWCEREGSLSL